MSSPSSEQLKNQGNQAFARQQFAEAVELFSQSLKVDATNHIVYSNRSAVYLCMAKGDASSNFLNLAVADAEKCIELNPKFAKGYVRLASALLAKKDYEGAVKAYTNGMSHCPSDTTLFEGLTSAQRQLNIHGASKNGDSDEKINAESEHVIGIDLGTTYSCVGVWIDGGIKMIPNDRGSITTPSFVSFNEKGKKVVGWAAKNQQSQYPKSTLFDIKRIIGQRFEEVTNDIQHFPFKVVSSQGEGQGQGAPLVEVNLGSQGIKRFAPEEVSAMILAYLKKTAEAYLKVDVKKAVITVPAYFSDAQRAATKAAGAIAGLEVLRIINEPTAAALSYNLDKRVAANAENGDADNNKSNILVFDLGGGTFDVSILTIEGGITEVKATGGNTHLGGEDFDLTTTNYLIQEAISRGHPDITNDPRAFQRLKTACEAAKRALSSSSETKVFVEGLFVEGKEKKRVDFSYNLTRDNFEKINKIWFTKCMETVKQVLKDAKMKSNDIHEVVLVGGSTRIPGIQRDLSQFFGNKQLCQSLNPDEAVAYGAAVQGAILSGKRDAALQGKGGNSSLVLLDVTPLSLGIETVGKNMSVVMPRNTPIPCIKTAIYTTEQNYQTQVDISVYEGERPKTTENNLLGEFTISGIESAKRGEPKIEVTFAIDSNGMLNVTAVDLKTNAKANISIASESRASNDDIERMIADAEKYRLQDEEQAKRSESINQLEEMINNIHTFVSDLDDNKDKERVKKIEAEQTTSEVMTWIEEHSEDASLSDLIKKRNVLESLMRKLKLRA